ncbi:F0F1 ATP synthase subunit gamma [Tropicimonas isoalkanivorans]|uniref:F-type H+-transporting ATPase subunit gamma n=1 Tax=Tropicimonas isoalkanivorans TaxID=441112 RepID=A0A1I1LBY1_9RHOB|nr:FoF1 ATP synthase subunit gamma [Tropicimonas isoalkanivorans]SFC67040.1 F-type H+-transporting ATPase subunit gamma [Tropicimonas isoalkanivorans]
MTGRLAEMEARIATVHKLASVISAMRGIAASRAMEARRHVDSIRIFAETIGEAIGHALAEVPEAGRAPAGDGPAGRLALIVIAGEQGFAGAYSERVFDAAAGLLGGAHDLFLAGDRGALVAAEREIKVAWSAPMVGHAAQATALATRLTEAIYRALANGTATRVSIVHAMPGGTQEMQVVTRQIVPFDYRRFPLPAHGVAPRLTLPPETLLARLVEEYVFSELTEAVMLAFAAENEARMRAMIAAHENVTARLDTLVAAARRLRQDEITDEIVELTTGSVPAEEGAERRV